MRQAVFASGLVATFVTLSAVVEHTYPPAKPRVYILQEADIKDNSFVKKNLGFTFETEQNVTYEVMVNKCVVEDKYISAGDNQKEGGVVTHTVRDIEQYVHAGKNTIEVVVTKESQAPTVKTIVLEIGLEQKVINGVQFKLCKRAVQDYAIHQRDYSDIAEEVKKLNKLMPEGYPINTIAIIYNKPCASEDCNIPVGGTNGAWIENDTVMLGYGVISHFRGTNEVRDALTHEFGHRLHQSLPIADRCEFEWCCWLLQFWRSTIPLFKDGTYTKDPAAGHPYDSGSELFASAFLISKNYRAEFEKRLTTFPSAEQERAMNVIELVREKYGNKKQ